MSETNENGHSWKTHQGFGEKITKNIKRKWKARGRNNKKRFLLEKQREKEKSKRNTNKDKD